jgi:4-amino-4-deoxy-L-arabinose transferase-like glycosyltransferase
MRGWRKGKMAEERDEAASPGWWSRPERRREWLLLGLIMVVAAVLRLYRLDTVPPGLTHDEAGNGKAAIQLLEGDFQLYFTIGNGREPLYAYSMAPLIALLGATEVALRATSVLWGLALILVTWLWVRVAFDPVIALLCAAALGVGYWPLMISRLGLRAGTLPVLFAVASVFLWKGMAAGWRPSRAQSGTRGWVWYLLTGIALGASLYTYMASRALPAILVLFLIYLALVHHAKAGRVWRGLSLALCVALLVAVPLWRYLSTHPQAETRIGQLTDALKAAREGNLVPVRENVAAAIRLFTVPRAGDPHWIYNISGRPLLDPVSGLLFYLGLGLALWRWRDPAHFFTVAWLTVGLAPVFATGANSSVVRAVAALPVAFLLQALALRWLTSWLLRRGFRVVSLALPLVALLAIGGITVRAYFQDWPNERDVRVAYHTTLVEMARYLDRRADGSTVTISSIYPGFFHDPYSFDFASHRDDLVARWFDGRFALIFPDIASGYAAFPAIAPLDGRLEPFFAPHADLMERVALREDDLNPWFEVYRWRPREAVQGLPTGEEVDFGHVVTLVGHQLMTPSVGPGGTVEVLTFWRVLNAEAVSDHGELVLFTHLLDGAGQVAAQQDRLDVPAWNWRSGDLFVQLHRFTMTEELAGGLYPLEVGVYSRTEGNPRLPVYGPDGLSVVGDSLRLASVEVRADE